MAFFCNSLRYGGVHRVISLLVNMLSKEEFFKFYLITKFNKCDGEYNVPKNTIRISLLEKRISLIELIKSNQIDILVYNFYNKSQINELNKLNITKILYYDHSSYFYWIYLNILNFNNSIYKVYKNCDYVISLIPLENDYLFKKWGINSILIDNPTTFEYDLVKPSELTNKNIIMIGRSTDPIKRYNLGIEAMEVIIKEIPECNMNIVSSPEKNYEKLIKNLNLEKYIRFVGFHKNIEIFLRNSSLHILPSLSEAYPMVLSEAKMFGIPSIIIGLDYLALAKGGTVIINDDNPNSIAKEAIRILKDDETRKMLGKEARKSVKKHTNNVIKKKWVKLLYSIYRGNKQNLKELSDDHDLISDEEAEKILNNQLIFLKKRRPILKKVNLEKLKTFSLF